MFSYLKRGKGFYRNLLLLSLPVVLQNLITTSLAMVDTFMVGMLGETPLAAVTVANLPITVIQFVVFGIQSGSAVLISQYWGKKDLDSINRVVGVSAFVAGSVSVLFALALFFFPTQVMGLLTNDAVLRDIAAQYGRIVGFSYIFNSLTGVYVGAHRSMENPKLGLIVFSISMCANTILNWIFIFGNLGAPRLGVVGAALATLISRILEFAVMVLYAVSNKRFRLRPALALRPGAEISRKFLKYATPVVLNETLWGLGTSLYPTIMGHMNGSTEILAAYAVAGNIDRFCTVAVLAVGATSAIIVGMEVGAGRTDQVYDVGKTLNVVSVALGAVIGAVMLLATYFVIEPYFYPIYPAFQNCPGAAKITTMILTVVALFLPARAFNSTNIVGVLRGGGDVRFATIIDLLPLWLVALPLAALAGLAAKLDILWVYLAIEAENVTKFFMGVIRFRSGNWIHDVTQVSYKKEQT
ncbi:MAG: MATE family efflux transporter [Oscillospiraceae bacterium]